jgi:glycosidase
MSRCAVALRRVFAALTAAALLGVAGAPAAAQTGSPARTDRPGDIGSVEVINPPHPLPDDWAKRGTFIEIKVRSYQDSNGDGIGDLNGLTSRLDYLKSLGVSGIWLMPIFQSEDRDHGYAVVDYRAIEPDYGTLTDLDRLLAEAHRRGIGVILDYVINHSAASHPAFESAYDDRKSPYADWFIFKDEPQPGWNTFSGSPWREAGQRWYYAVFDARMPDFNLRNPQVIDFHLNNLRFWLNRGVDGFRFDAVGVLVENRAIAWENQPENHAVMKGVKDLLAQYDKRFMVCEAPSDPGAFAVEDSCGNAFAFGLQKHIIGSVKLGRTRAELVHFLRTQNVARMSTLLSNHDYFAGQRLSQQFRGDEASYRLAAGTLLTLPGTPFLYYGEEIGLGQSEPVRHDDQAIRGPMSWSAERNAGFTTAAEPFRPLVGNWKTHNVAAQDADPKSLLNWYRSLIGLRNAEPALSIGSYTALSTRDEPVFTFLREHEGTRLLVAINFAYREAATTLPADVKPNQWRPVFPAEARPDIGPRALPAATPPPAVRKRRPAGAAAPAAPPAPPNVADAPLRLRLGPQQMIVLKVAP